MDEQDHRRDDRRRPRLIGFIHPRTPSSYCGDAFVAAALTRFVESESDIGDMSPEELEDIFRFASASAALAATAEGAIPSMPGREEVLELIELGGVQLPEETEGESEDDS